MRRCRSTAVVLAMFSLTGCGDPRPPGVFDLSLDEAYRRLSDNALPELVSAKQCGILIHVTPQGIPHRQVNWQVTSSGQQVVYFTAALTPVNEKQTKVDIVMPAAPEGGEVYDGTKFYPRPAFNQPLRPAVEEQVAAILEGRKFDVSHLGPDKDSVCNIQRGGLESGLRFRVDDIPGMDSRQSAACQSQRRLGVHC